MKTEIIKDSKNLGSLLIKEIDYDIAKKMIIENHYSHKWNTAFGKINIGIFKNDVLLGCAVFGNLMNPNSYKNINSSFTKDNVVELNRLWIDDTLGHNAETILLGGAWKIIRNDYPNIKAVQSFADGRLGCGTIYKASNFNYYGYEKTLFYENIKTQEVFHKVPMENTMRPNGLISLNKEYCLGNLKPFYVKTYKYIYPLYKNTKIELTQLPYPSYDKGISYIEDYIHSKNLIFRSLILSYILNQKEDFNIFKDYINKNFDKKQIIENVKYSLENASIKKIALDRKKNDRFEKIKNIYKGK